MARRKAPEVTERGAVELERDGTVHRGSYVVADDTVTVHGAMASKTGHLGGLPAASLALILLGELVRDEEIHFGRSQS